MGKIDGQKEGAETQVQRTDQERYRHAATERDRESGQLISGSKLIGAVGTDSPNRVGGNTARFLLGGIIAQLIDQTLDQLGDAHECIATYQKRIARLEKQLENLRRLQEVKEVKEDQIN